MQTVTAQLITNKKVLLRLDLDVPLRQAQGHGQLEVEDDFRLKAGLPTLKLCLENAEQVIVMGHIGRPTGEDPNFSVAPIHEWLKNELDSGKLKLLENLRFEEGEEDADLEYAKKLAEFGDFFVNEAFAAYHQAASNTILPTLLPHAAGLHFADEVKTLTKVRENPQKPLVVIMGGAKVKGKLPAIESMAKIADAVLVGGKLASEIRDSEINVSHNVLVGKLTEDGLDLADETIEGWRNIIKGAKMIVWNGPLGKVEEGHEQSRKIAQMVIDSGTESIVGGGDTTSALTKWGMLDKFSFVSTGGGAMLEFLTKGTLPTIEALS